MKENSDFKQDEMTLFKRTVFPVIMATVWIIISEFVRNEFIVKTYWISHYESLGMVFPSEPINGAMWGLWSFLFAIAILILSRKFSLVHTTLISWFTGFVLMWVVIGNMGVLPYGLLFAAVPLSLLESFVASLIIVKLSGPRV